MDVCAGVGAERLAEQWITADQILAGGFSMYSFSETDEIFPGALDALNDPNHPDLHLGSFRF